VLSTEYELKRSLYVTVHEERNEIEIFCFDCDANALHSAILQLAENGNRPPIL
jgi:hypothetical protein